MVFELCIKLGLQVENQKHHSRWMGEGRGYNSQVTSNDKKVDHSVTIFKSQNLKILKYQVVHDIIQTKKIWGGHQLSMRNALTVWFIDIEVSNPRVNMYLVNSSSGMALDHNGRLVGQYTRSGTIIITGGSRYSSSYEGMQEINGFTKTTIAFQFWSYRINRH